MQQLKQYCHTLTQMMDEVTPSLGPSMSGRDIFPTMQQYVQGNPFGWPFRMGGTWYLTQARRYLGDIIQHIDQWNEPGAGQSKGMHIALRSLEAKFDQHLTMFIVSFS
jgi:hypothetical protein